MTHTRVSQPAVLYNGPPPRGVERVTLTGHLSNPTETVTMSNGNNVPKLRPEPAPLPVKAQDVIEQGRFNRSLNDEIFYIHPTLMEANEKYRDYLYAIWPEGAVEGNLDIDDTMAAMVIRDYGRTHGITRIANSNLAAIRHSLRVVCKRYAMSRKERREKVVGDTIEVEAGETFPDDNNNGLN